MESGMGCKENRIRGYRHETDFVWGEFPGLGKNDHTSREKFPRTY